MNRNGVISAVLLSLALAAGCSSNKEAADTTKGNAGKAAPAMSGQDQSGSAPAAPASMQGRDTASGLTWDVPSGFQKEAPANTMRAAQYVIPSGKEGEKNGELAVFFFGSGMGGSTQDNLQRWANQFQQADKSDPMQKAKIENFNAGALKVTTIEVSGHYVSSMMGNGPSYDEPGWKLYGAVVEGSGGPWFFKAVGPEDVIDKYGDALSKLYHGLQPAAT